MPEPPSSRKWLKWLRHPLTVLLVGTGLSWLLLPWLAEDINHGKLIREARLKEAMEIIEDNMQTQSNLNRLLTTLELFDKDNSGPAARLVDYRQEQRTLRRVMAERYLEFDKQAWWWYDRIQTEGSILELTSPAELQRLGDISREYGASLSHSTEILNDLWSAFLRQAYRPSDPENEKLREEARCRLGELDRERFRLVMESAEILKGR